MRKHSLNHITSHQNLKVFLYHQLNKKSHYFPQSKSQKRDANTKPKKLENKKQGAFGSWLYESNKQNRNRCNMPQYGSKKGIKTTKKNSCSYIGCNTSVQDSENNKNFQTFNFGSLKASNKQIFKMPVAVTDADVVTKQSSIRDDFDTIYSKLKNLLGRYRDQLSNKEKRIKELKKQNKLLKDKQMKYQQRKL